MNDNEKFITKATLKIANKLKINLEEKQVLREVLYECSRNYNILEIEYKENSFMEMVELYLQVKKLEGETSIQTRIKFIGSTKVGPFLLQRKR